jgi:uncharacterized membrane protein YeiB
MAHPTPVASGERLETLDVLRGFALLGILAMNIRAMAAPFSAYMNPTSVFEYAGASRAAYVFTSVVFDLKMMGLFSMLFGAGVLLYAGKATETGAPPRGLWFRRMFWLLLIGLTHAYLIWNGDILVPYALCGILLLWWVRRLSPRMLAIGAFVMLAIGVTLTMGWASACLPVGLALAWYGVSELERVRFVVPDRMILDVWNYVGAVFASVGYAAVLILIVKRGVLVAVRRRLAAVGQMALSNYLFQSIVTSIVFLGWGLGLAGRFDYAGQLIVVAAIWAIQLALSPVWLRRYRFGPAEWCWRSLTYWQRQQTRKPEATAT